MYSLCYYKDLGNYLRLEIYRHNPSQEVIEAVEIGNVIQGLSLAIQGQNDSIDSPIIKTSLSMTMADANDLNDGKMNGAWDFFAKGYETEWRIKIVAIEEGTNPYDLWTGYVTPDSYSEDLSYRGSCSITARDNVGQLQNYNFDADGDADGMISMRNIVEAAWGKIKNGMDLIWCSDDGWLKTADGRTPAPDTLLNVSAFADKTWYEVLESVLYSFGAVMRYNNSNGYIVCPLRYLPTLGKLQYNHVPSAIPILLSGASKEYAPAAKSIEESTKFEIEKSKSFENIDGFLSASTYPCSVEHLDNNGQLVATTSTGVIHPISGNAHWGNNATTSLFFDLSRFPVDSWIAERGYEKDIRQCQYIAANNTDSRAITYSEYIDAFDFDICLQLGNPIGIHKGSGVNGGKIGVCQSANLKKIVYALSIESLEQGSEMQYYYGHGIWKTSYHELVEEYDYNNFTNEIRLPILIGTLSGRAKLTFKIIKIEYVKVGVDYTGVGYSFSGLYAAIKDVSFNLSKRVSLRSINRVNTKYNDTNNLILRREPQFAPAFERVFMPQFIKNGIFERLDGEVLPASSWIVHYDRGGEQISQMAVGIHMQLLSYYSKPNSKVNGTIVNMSISYPPTIYIYEGHEHILLSGTYNYLTGHIEGAVLREFLRYDSIWEDAEMPETDERSIF